MEWQVIAVRCGVIGVLVLVAVVMCIVDPND